MKQPRLIPLLSRGLEAVTAIDAALSELRADPHRASALDMAPLGLLALDTAAPQLSEVDDDAPPSWLV